MVYIFDELRAIDDNVLRWCTRYLPRDRAEKASRYYRRDDKVLCVLSYLLLRYGIYREYGITDAPSFRYGSCGKPYLAESEGIFFNLSHCSSGVASFVADIENGIDIQDWQRYDQKLADRICGEGERIILAQAPQRDELFTILWTLKESYYKCSGAGISNGMSRADFSRNCADGWIKPDFKEFGLCFNVKLLKGFCVSICHRGEKPEVEHVSLRSLRRELCNMRQG